jgi:hypothetical protein
MLSSFRRAYEIPTEMKIIPIPGWTGLVDHERYRDPKTYGEIETTGDVGEYLFDRPADIYGFGHTPIAETSRLGFLGAVLKHRSFEATDN